MGYVRPPHRPEVAAVETLFGVRHEPEFSGFQSIGRWKGSQGSSLGIRAQNGQGPHIPTVHPKASAAQKYGLSGQGSDLLHHGMSRQVAPRHSLRNGRIVDFPVVRHDELSTGEGFPLGEGCDPVKPVRERTGKVYPDPGKVRDTQECDTTQKSRAG